MAIHTYRVKQGHKPKEIVALPPEGLQAKVSCMGDIAVMPFYPGDCDGVAWLLLEEGPVGEPGRTINDEVDTGPRLLTEQPGVLIGAEDPRSLDAIINALSVLRTLLEEKQEAEKAEED